MKAQLSAQKLTQTRSVKCILLVLFLLGVFAMGGSSLQDVHSLAVLRPLSVLMVGFGLATLRIESLRGFSIPIILLIAGFAMALIQIIPLPPTIWHHLAQRSFFVSIDNYLGIAGNWRPLSFDPVATRDSIFSLFTPAAAFLLAIGISPRERRSVLFLVCTLGMVSAILGLLQGSTETDSSLFLYQNSNEGSSPGLFANRNHQALFLALCVPLSFAWADSTSAGTKINIARIQINRNFALAWIYVLFLAFMIMVIGSRAGLLLGIFAAIGTVAIFSLPQRSSDQNEPRGVSKSARLLKAYFLVLLVGLTVAVIALYFGRAEALTRLLSTDQAAEERLSILPTVLAMTKDFMPFGTGYGSFEAVFKAIEPEKLLSYTVMNRAHNDWLEFLLTGGMLAWLLLFWFEYAIFKNFRRLMKQIQSKNGNVKLGFSALLIIILFGLASLGDYPLRMPSLQCVFVLTLMVFLDAANASESHLSK